MDYVPIISPFLVKYKRRKLKLSSKIPAPIVSPAEKGGNSSARGGPLTNN